MGFRLKKTAWAGLDYWKYQKAKDSEVHCTLATMFLSLQVIHTFWLGVTSCCYTYVFAITTMFDAYNIAGNWEKSYVVSEQLQVKWLEIFHILKTYSILDLEDKVHFNGGGNVMCLAQAQWPRLDGLKRKRKANVGGMKNVWGLITGFSLLGYFPSPSLEYLYFSLCWLSSFYSSYQIVSATTRY